MAAGALNWAYPAAQVSRVLGLIRPADRVQPEARPLNKHRGTPEIYFAKTIDNSRLVKVSDPARTREVRMFIIACAVLFFMMMIYAWQHFSAIEYGYRIEAQKSQRESLQEVNRQLRLEEAALRDPERIDRLAQRMGLKSAQVGQVLRMDQPLAEPSAAVMASAAASVNSLGGMPAAR